MIDFKYTTKDKVEKLIFNLYEQEGCDCPIEYLKSQKELMRLVYSRDTMLDLEKALALVESFLHLFEKAEEYELCASIIKTWPELKK
tara:strand:- start:49 stop:309 length:261 start_codon:yes stop_codon:yes gene_type:complete